MKKLPPPPPPNKLFVGAGAGAARGVEKSELVAAGWVVWKALPNALPVVAPKGLAGAGAGAPNPPNMLLDAPIAPPPNGLVVGAGAGAPNGFAVVAAPKGLLGAGLAPKRLFPPILLPPMLPNGEPMLPIKLFPPMAGAGVANGLAAGAGAPQALVLVLSQAIILCHYIRKEEWAVWRGKPRRGVQSEGVAQDLKGVLRTNTEVLFELMLFLFDSFLCSENSSALAHVS